MLVLDMLTHSLIALTVLAQAPAPKTKTPSPQTLAARTLVDAELAFAKLADSESTNAAFLSVLDATGILFRPGPVNGRTWLKTQTTDATKLTWYPAFVEVSQAGDLGYSTGPYEWRPEAGSTQVSQGHFVSVWERHGGMWKLMLDTGISHAAPAEEDPIFRPENSKSDFISASTRLSVMTFSAEALQALDLEFSSTASARGVLFAYSTYLAPEARFYRPGDSPTHDVDAVKRLLQTKQGSVSWSPMGGGVAKSSDLGYTYGLSEFKPKTKTGKPPAAVEMAAFLHIWKRQSSGRWKLILDIENPIAPSKAKAQN